ncbi:MAG: hypothetical protein NC133_04130, partial [Prevotella sp.]|nr:hypothetical protein [Prevotella sp.]
VYPLQESALAAVEQSEFDEKSLWVDITKIKATPESKSPTDNQEQGGAEIISEGTEPEDEDNERDNLRNLLSKKLKSLKVALKPFLSAGDFEELMNSDPISVLEMLETMITKLHKKDIVAAAMAIELQSFIENKIFNFAESDMNSA